MLRIRTAHSTRVVGGSTSGTMGSDKIETPVTSGEADVENPAGRLEGGSAKSTSTDQPVPEGLETQTYLRKQVANMPVAI